MRRDPLVGQIVAANDPVLASLLNVPRDQSAWDHFSWDHQNSHRLIREAIFAQKGVSLPEYVIYPINFDRFTDFLQANAQEHIDMLSTLGIQGEDLQDVDIRDERQLVAWSNLHYLDHYNAENALKIGS